MKKLVSLVAIVSLMLTGCFETTQEITLNDDGSGSLVTTNDMSLMIGLAKQMGGDKDLKEIPKLDSSFSVGARADSIPGLTQEEKDLARNGIARVKMDVAQDQMIASLSFTFKSLADLSKLNTLTSRIMESTMKDKLGKGNEEAIPAPSETSSVDDYYTLSFVNGSLSRTIKKDKYDNVGSDEFLQSMKEVTSMGLDMKSTYIINLPRPASKAEGKNLTLSADKKKVTITGGLTDFFDDPSALEFSIKY